MGIGMDRSHGSYYAVIPAAVRYDKDLQPNAKLLYGEITALCNEHGYCWATNKYFAELYGVSIRCVQNWLTVLSQKNHIEIRFIKQDDGKENRCIFIQKQAFFSPPVQLFSGGNEEKCAGGHEKKCTQNNTCNNNTCNISLLKKEKYKKEKKISPQETSEGSCQTDEPIDEATRIEALMKSVEPPLQDLYRKYIRMRDHIKSPITADALEIIISRVRAYSEGDADKARALLEDAILNNWKNVYPPKATPKAEDGQGEQKSELDDIFR